MTEMPAKVLLVDDIAANLFALEIMLKSKHFLTVTANSGVEALRLVDRHEFACCLMDIRMPEMDGFETAQRIRESVRHHNLPIIFVTAEVHDQQNLFKGYKMGAVDFLIKPLEPAVVKSKVRVFVDLFLQKKALDRSKEIECLNNRLTVANQDLEHFIQIASHDLREPLRKQANLIELLHSDLPKDCDVEVLTLCDLIKRESHKMYRLVEGLREFARISGLAHHREQADLRGLIMNCLNTFRSTLLEREIRWEFQEFPRVVDIYVSLVTILYRQLIANALQHTSGKPFSMTFTCEETDKGMTFGVLNTGSTIPEEHLDIVFKIFRQATTPLSSHYGEGVGLSLCKRVIDRHQGVIWAEVGDDFTHIRYTFGGNHDGYDALQD